MNYEAISFLVYLFRSGITQQAQHTVSVATKEIYVCICIYGMRQSKLHIPTTVYSPQPQVLQVKPLFPRPRRRSNGEHTNPEPSNQSNIISHRRKKT